MVSVPFKKFVVFKILFLFAFLHFLGGGRTVWVVWVFKGFMAGQLGVSAFRAITFPGKKGFLWGAHLAHLIVMHPR